VNYDLVGGFNPPLKNISQLGLLFPIYGKIKNCSKPPTSGTLLVYLDHEMDKKSSSRKCAQVGPSTVASWKHIGCRTREAGSMLSMFL